MQNVYYFVRPHIDCNWSLSINRNTYFFELEKKDGHMTASKVEFAEWSSVLLSVIIIIMGICVLGFVGITAY